MAEDSDLEKTEAPTQHKINKAREKGQIARSRELTSILVMITGLSIFMFFGDYIAGNFKDAFRLALSFENSILTDEKRFIQFLYLFLEIIFRAILPIFSALILIAIFAPMLMGGIFFNPASIKFDMNRWNPISGIKRIFSVQIFAELLKGLLKAGLVGVVVYIYLDINLPRATDLMYISPSRSISELFNFIIICGFFVVLGIIPMVAFDIFYQLWSHIKKLKMTKQEIKDESKDQEGDPKVKGKIKQMQIALARSRMMADVPTADIVITNPTHFSVALKYEESKMSAPKVVAKGMGEVAHKIRDLAIENNVPILEAPPLARTLYRYSEVGQFIPTNLYAAVAEVLAWVYQLRHWKKNGGNKPQAPKDLPIPDNLLERWREIDG